jgi:MSHA biogenesis protein MshP
MNRFSQSAAGFALMAAIFVLVTLSAIAVYLLTVSIGQVAAVTQDEQATRAYQAARAGVEWGAFQVLRNSTGSFAATVCPAGGSTTVSLGTLGAPAAAATFAATVACSRTVESEGGVNNVRIYVITATGCNRAACPGATDATYVERQLQLVVSN